MQQKKRRKPRGNKFLKEYVQLKEKIYNDGLMEHYTEEENGMKEEWTTWKPTKNRLLYSLFEEFGKKVITKEDMKRIENISNNKLKILHNQLIAKNFIRIMDSMVTKLLSYKQSDYNTVNNKFPWSIMLKRDTEFFNKDFGNKDEKKIAKKYCRLAKILKRLPNNEEFKSVSGLTVHAIRQLIFSESFGESIQLEFARWRIPVSKYTSSNGTNNVNLKTKNETKDLGTELLLAWQEKSKYILNDMSKSTQEFKKYPDKNQKISKGMKYENLEEFETEDPIWGDDDEV
ncbi:MAG: hypothetical protein JSS63_09845 [Bacteroidetes bacterium]|nr:hypothetical protein [Bacteroidota bacterium]